MITESLSTFVGVSAHDQTSGEVNPMIGCDRAQGSAYNECLVALSAYGYSAYGLIHKRGNS